MDAVMLQRLGQFSLALFLVTTLSSVGCNRGWKRPSPTAAPAPSSLARGTAPPSRPLIIPENRPAVVRPTEGDDPAQLIPPPPSLASLQGEKKLPLEAIPPAPERATDSPAKSDLLPVAIRREPPPANDMKAIHERAVSQYAKIDAFEARLTRREVVNNREQPKEVLHFQFRKAPLSVRMKWISGEGQGREVLFVQGKYDNKMQILPARSDTAPLPPFKVAYAPDDPSIQAKSRHDIRQAGFAEAITHLGEVLKRIDRVPTESSRLRALGAVQRPEFAAPMDGIEEVILAKEDKAFPKGGRRLYFFDTTPNSPSTGLPVLVMAYDEKNREVEYYCFDRFMHPVRLDETDFDVKSLGTRR
jgi:hypothetical protein